MWKWILGILFFLTLGIAIFFSFFKFYLVPQSGMYPNLPEKRFILARKNPYSGPDQVRRGDIIVFASKRDGKDYNFIWRVIGIPGDTVKVTSNSVILNEQILEHWFIRQEGNARVFQEKNGNVAYEVAYVPNPSNPPPEMTITVPSGQFFVLGDHRNYAKDSRFMGTVVFTSIIGRKF